MRAVGGALVVDGKLLVVSSEWLVIRLVPSGRWSVVGGGWPVVGGVALAPRSLDLCRLSESELLLAAIDLGCVGGGR